jgi:cation transport protein ChaC
MLRARSSIQTHSSRSSPFQDGYTLERVDVYGLIDGVHEIVVIPGAECYVGRNDNPSFSSCGLFSIPRLPAFHMFFPSPFPQICFWSTTPVGSEPLGELSDIIWRAVGPSGPNKVQY